MCLCSEKPYFKWEIPQLPLPLSVTYEDMGCRYHNNLQDKLVNGGTYPQLHQQSLDMSAQRKDTQFFSDISQTNRDRKLDPQQLVVSVQLRGK